MLRQTVPETLPSITETPPQRASVNSRFWADYLGYTLIMTIFFGAVFLFKCSEHGGGTLNLVWLPHATTDAQVIAVAPKDMKDCSSEDWCSIVAYQFQAGDQPYTGSEEVASWDSFANPTIPITYNLADPSKNSPDPDDGSEMWLLVLLAFLAVPLLGKLATLLRDA